MKGLQKQRPAKQRKIRRNAQQRQIRRRGGKTEVRERKWILKFVEFFWACSVTNFFFFLVQNLFSKKILKVFLIKAARKNQGKRQNTFPRPPNEWPSSVHNLTNNITSHYMQKERNIKGYSKPKVKVTLNRFKSYSGSQDTLLINFTKGNLFSRIF